MKLSIPVRPLTINRAFQGRRFKTKDYKQYEWDLSRFLKGKKIKGMVEIRYKFYLKYFATTDVSNLIKLLEDCIVKAGLIDDDRKVKKFHAEKFKSKEDKIEINIKSLIK